jgi:hypothetical protein
MDANIDEGTKFSDIGDDTFEGHARLDIGDFANLFVEGWRYELLARVAAGLAKFLEDVVKCVAAGLQITAVDFLDELWLANDIADRDAQGLGDRRDDAVGLGVDRGHIERVIATADSEKACGLFECLRADAGNLCDLGARAKAAVLIAVLDDVVRRAFVDTCDIAQQSPRSGVEIDADAIDATLDDRFEATLQLALIDIVLILADSNRFGVDLD